MKTLVSKQLNNEERKWYLVDAEGKNLGRLSTEIAKILKWKNKVTFSPHLDNWDYVVVINAEKISVTWDKLNKKVYYSHSWFLGWLKEITLWKLLVKKPTESLKKAIYWMLPKNKLRKRMMLRLKLVAWTEHTFQAQKPELINL